MKNKIWTRVGVYVLVSLVLLIPISVITGYYSFWDYMLNLRSFNTLDILLGQMANTFIVLSLTSVLSTNIGSVYWVNVKNFKLVIPFFQCFLALTTYLLTTLVFAIGAYAIQFNAGVCTAFTTSVALLIFLTFKMIGVYFGRDDIKERLKWEYKLAMLDAELSYYFYREKIEHLKKTCADNKPLYTNKQIQQINSRYQAFQNAEIIGFTKTVNKEKIYLFTELVNQLKEKTLQALNSNDFSIVQENIDLLIEAEDVFNLLDILDSIITYNIMCTLVKTKF